ncbi:hypothetical protein C7974DRAFT_381681 [Boeremia exigua]|uniref:uncharacterized protein n=1 Tax=Boeremia exigua TaxID=749465 RepID=UPI001E8E7184|nr:uncharacterized protein C7974DRAFT_381681 [Boeremia exigua]KAH6643505.1 hypothetical protein C7974DRAFT_381681 [Boeremia exigua]
MYSHKKRMYAARVKGCHQCSQRRVSCDLTEPFCRKCSFRGLDCSGYSKTRYRFADDLIAQGKAPGGLRIHPWGIESHRSGSEGRMPRRKEDWKDAALLSKREQESPPTLSREHRVHRHEHLQLSNGLLNANDQCLFRCFSEEIASKFVVIDDDYNQWRLSVLPLAYCDDLVKSAVCAASVCYLATRAGRRSTKPYSAYQCVLQGLREKQELLAHDTTAKQGILVALLLLLATAIVNGLPDFRRIFHLIEVFLSITQEDNILGTGSLGPFLCTQIEKFRGYAAPYLSRHQGLAILRLTTPIRPSISKGWEEFTTCCELHPELHHVLSNVYDLSAQACEMYITRLRLGVRTGDSTQPLLKFRATLESIPDHCLVDSNTFVFSVFIAACESVTVKDQMYFSNVLHKKYERLGFANVLTALNYLQMYWDGQTSRDWVDLMTKYDVWIF